MLIVSGNHDYSFNTAAGNFIKYDKQTKNIQSEKTVVN